jgi:hypothetical protein
MPEFSATFELVDAYNRPSRKTFVTVADMADFDAAATSAAALFVDLAVLTEMRVLAYTISQRVSVTDAVTAGANKDEGVTFTLRKSDNFKDDIRIPGPINAIFDDNGNVITEPALPVAVSDFLANFADGTGDWTFSDGEQWTEFVIGKLDQ